MAKLLRGFQVSLSAVGSLKKTGSVLYYVMGVGDHWSTFQEGSKGVILDGTSSTGGLYLGCFCLASIIMAHYQGGLLYSVCVE